MTLTSSAAVSKNTLIGNRQLNAATGTITENTHIGCRILVGATSGTIANNAILGSDSLRLIIAHTGINRNTLLGGRVLYNAVMSGSNTINDNIIIGYNAGSAYTNGVSESSFSWPVFTTPPDKDHETICNKKVE